MKLYRKVYLLFAVLLFSTVIVGCSVPTYYKEITTKYDADGKVIGTEVKEGISQPSPHSAPLKVNTTKQKVLEK
ncbi:MAG TPA: hypothetical protein ENJ13_08090 [Chromatiales bacterium]|nr:hypothetical protein [Chromatiales bacterium]